MGTNNNWYPNIAGQVTSAVEYSIRYLYDKVYSILDRVRALESKPPVPPDINSIRQAMQANGSSPINITGLIGVLSQPQLAKAPTIHSLPGFDNPLAQDGTLSIFQGVVYFYSMATNPGKWIPVGAIGTIIQTTHSGKAAISASFYPIGTLLFETDRTVMYVNQGTYGSSNWVYILGIYYSILSNRPTDLGVNDTGFLFHSTDNPATQRWDGTNWIVEGEIGVMLADTHANRVSGYLPVNFPIGTTFFETDRTVIYRNNGTNWIYITGIMRSVFGSEPTLGTSDAGFLFYATDQNIIYLWNGTVWSVFATVGVAYRDTHANRSGYTPANFPIGALYNESDRYSLYRNSGSAWVLVIAWYATAIASRPADLGANDVGFQFYATDTLVGYYWTGAAWVAIGSGGSTPGAWSPYTPSGTNLTGVSGASGSFLSYGSVCFFQLTITGTPTVTTNPVVITIPVSPATNDQTFPVSMVAGGSRIGGTGTLSGTSFSVQYANPTAFAATSHTFVISGSFRI